MNKIKKILKLMLLIAFFVVAGYFIFTMGKVNG